MTPKKYVNQLAAFDLSGVFNPYRDRCTDADKVDAPRIRRANLTNYMSAMEGAVRVMWFGRDLGYRGGRRTGLALTDESHLASFSRLYGGVEVDKATRGAPVSERTASIVWDLMGRLPDAPFLWNIFPFHPHEAEDPHTNRCHTAAERRACAPLIHGLLDWAQPKVVVAIGNDAYAALSGMGYECEYVRHPSYGGQADFISGMERIYGVPPVQKPKQNSLL